jgi:hypothetical protein
MSSESAETLERESEIRLHEPAIAPFRQDILKGNWDSVSNHLNVLGITNEDNLHVCIFTYMLSIYIEYNFYFYVQLSNELSSFLYISIEYSILNCKTKVSRIFRIKKVKTGIEGVERRSGTSLQRYQSTS